MDVSRCTKLDALLKKRGALTVILNIIIGHCRVLLVATIPCSRHHNLHPISAKAWYLRGILLSLYKPGQETRIPVFRHCQINTKQGSVIWRVKHYKINRSKADGMHPRTDRWAYILTLEDKVVGLLWPHVVSIQQCRPTAHCSVSSSELLISGCKMTLTHSTISPAPTVPHAPGRRVAAKRKCFDTRVPPTSSLSLLALSLSLSVSIWVQLACLDKTCWLYPGCSAVVGGACAREWLGVCLRSGVSAGQVEQVEWLAGTAERGCRAPPAGAATPLQAGSRKGFITYMEITSLKKFGISDLVTRSE